MEVAEKKEKTKAELAAERDKAMDEAHKKYVAATEAARKEYVETKKRLYPELSRPTPEQQEKIIKELREKVALLEKQKTEAPT